MSMFGIDVSVYQNGLNFTGVIPSPEFVIAKGTDGARFVDRACDSHIQQAITQGRLFGFYMFANAPTVGSVQAQVTYFVQNCKGYFKRGIPVLDWENSTYGGNVLHYGPGLARQFLDEIYRQTGVRPMIYMSASVTTAYDWSAVATDYGLWGAGYAYGATAANPKTDRYRWGAWKYPAIHQYSSSGNLDKDVAYMDATGWNKFAGGTGTVQSNTNIPAKTKQQATHAPTGSTIGLVVRTMQGAYGNGDARKAALGNRYDEVMSVINHISSASASTLASEVWQGKYGSGDLRKIVLGNRYAEVMAIVNGKTKHVAVYYPVKSGDTLSAIASRNGTTVRDIMLLNSGIKNPNYIVAGWKIRVK